MVGAPPAAEGLALSKHLRQRMFALSRRVEQDHLDGAVRVRGARGRPMRIRAGRHRVEAGGCALSFRSVEDEAQVRRNPASEAVREREKSVTKFT